LADLDDMASSVSSDRGLLCWFYAQTGGQRVGSTSKTVGGWQKLNALRLLSSVFS